MDRPAKKETLGPGKTVGSTPDPVPVSPDDKTSIHLPPDAIRDPHATDKRGGGAANDDAITNDDSQSNVAKATPTKLPRIDGYEVLSVLGRGGMGVVYKARQKGLNRHVALKMILSGEHASEAEIARFRLEAEAVARLQHPNIVQIHEIGEADGFPFFSLEFVDGGSLANVLDGEPQIPQDAARMTQVLAEAMQFAHENRIVHRDLKPGNVLLNRKAVPTEDSSTIGPTSRITTSLYPLGFPKITDFGLAKQLGDQSGRTQSGSIMGTPSYMAPEQAMGHVRELGAGVDIYSLGAILYEMLTGRPPFRGATTLDTLELVRFQEPVPPSRLQPKISRDLETICLKCLQKEPEARYSTAGELAEDLRRFLDGEPIRARPVGRVERLRRWCARNPGTALLVSAIAATLIGGSVFSTYFAIRAGRGERAAEEQARIALERKKESDRRRYVAEYRWAMQKWKDGRIDEVRDILHELEPRPDDDVDLRHFEWYYLQRLCQLELRTLDDHKAPLYRVTCSRDGRWLATAGDDGHVCLWDRAAGKVCWISPGNNGPIYAVAFSPDGRLLAFAGQDTGIRILDVTTRKEVNSLPGNDRPIHALAFHPTRLELVSTGDDKKVRIWNLTTKQWKVLPENTGKVNGLAYSPTTGMLYTAEDDGRLLMWDTANGTSMPLIEKLTVQLLGLALSSDGQRVAANGSDQVTRVWDATTGKLIGPIAMPDLHINNLALSPDGSRVATASNDGIVRIWQVETGRVALTLRGHTALVMGVSFSEDGWQLFSASADRTVKVWDANVSQEKLAINTGKHAAFAVALSPDDRFAVTASFDGMLRVWNVDTGILAQSIRGHASEVYGVCFLADSGRFVSVGKDGAAHVWDVQSGAAAGELEPTQGPLKCCACSRDGKWLAAGGPGGMITIWDLSTGKITQRLNHQSKQVVDIAFHPTEHWLASVSDDHSTRVFDLDADKPKFELCEMDNAGDCTAFSPDGRFLVAGADLGIWDLATGQKLRSLQPADRLPQMSVAVSSDSRRVVATGPDALVRVWDAATGLELLTLPGQRQRGRGVALSPSGRCLASVDESGLLQIWNAGPLTPDQLELREAASLVRFLSRKTVSRDGVIQAIKKHPGISDSMRQRALALVNEGPAETTKR